MLYHRNARLYLRIFMGLTAYSYYATRHLTFANILNAAFLAGLLQISLLFAKFILRTFLRPGPKRDGLDRVLFRYPTGDPFRLRQLLTSIYICGIIGSGKTSSSGLFFARLVLRVKSSGLILGSNPDDVAWWTTRFREAGRLDDLIVFSATAKSRWNFLGKLQEGGADAREITQYLITASESLVESKGKEDLYWKLLSERLLYNVISALMLGGRTVSAGSISNFISSAAYTFDQLNGEAFQNGYCCRVLKAAKARALDPIAAGDYALLEAYWKGSFVYLDDKPRMSALSGVENITHCLSVGHAREIFATTTNASCEDLTKGKWILMDFPVSAGGPTSKLIYGCAKLAVQKQVLKNRWDPSQPITVIWADEASHVLNSGDRDFLKESRKHGGVLVFLTQTILDFVVALGDENKAKGLLGLFGTRIFHAADVATGDYGVELAGEVEQEELGGSYTPSNDLNERLGGKSNWTGSFTFRRSALMTCRQFTSGMRMGGQSKVVDAWVYRPELFADGTNMQRMQFIQE